MRRPSAADETRLPAALAALLAFGLVLALALPATTELPPVAQVAPARLPASPAIAPLDTGAAFLAAPIFAPDRQPAREETGPAAAAGLPGLSVVGVVKAGRTVRILLRDGARLLSVPPGAEVRDWRIVALDPGGVTFERDGDRRRLVIGASPTAEDTSADDEEQQESQ